MTSILFDGSMLYECCVHMQYIQIRRTMVVVMVDGSQHHYEEGVSFYTILYVWRLMPLGNHDSSM